MSYGMPDFKNEAERLRWAIDTTTLDMEEKDKKRLHDAMLKLDEEDLYALYRYFRVQSHVSYEEGREGL
jgi:hypothetical protein